MAQVPAEVMTRSEVRLVAVTDFRLQVVNPGKAGLITLLDLVCRMGAGKQYPGAASSIRAESRPGLLESARCQPIQVVCDGLPRPLSSPH